MAKTEHVSLVAAFNRNGMLLLGRRLDSGKWTVAGGHANEGEDADRCAVRELYEEAGLKAKKLVRLDRRELRDGALVLTTFEAEVEGTPTGKNDPDRECDEWHFVDVSDGVPKNIAENMVGGSDPDKNVILDLFGLRKSERVWGEPLSKSESSQCEKCGRVLPATKGWWSHSDSGHHEINPQEYDDIHDIPLSNIFHLHRSVNPVDSRRVDSLAAADYNNIPPVHGHRDQPPASAGSYVKAIRRPVDPRFPKVYVTDGTHRTRAAVQAKRPTLKVAFNLFRAPSRFVPNDDPDTTKSELIEGEPLAKGKGFDYYKGSSYDTWPADKPFPTENEWLAGRKTYDWPEGPYKESPAVRMLAHPDPKVRLRALDYPDMEREHPNTPEFHNWFAGSKVVDHEGKPRIVFHGTRADFNSFDPGKLGAATEAPSAAQGFFFSGRSRTADSYTNMVLPHEKEEHDKIFDEARNTKGPNIPRSYTKAYQKLKPEKLAALKQQQADAHKRSADLYRQAHEMRTAGGNVMPVYLNLKNPYVHDMKLKGYRDQSYNDIIQQAKAKGHDGVIIRNTYDAVLGDALPDNIYVAFHPHQIKSAIGNQGTFDPNHPEITKSEPGVEDGSHYPLAGTHVDGLAVGPKVSNMESIGASLNDHTIHQGVREVPMSEFNTNPHDLFYAADDHQRARQLADTIRQSGRIDPLIVVHDSQGPYVLEGAHRLAALHHLGKKSFPALVVRDDSDAPAIDLQKMQTPPTLPNLGFPDNRRETPIVTSKKQVESKLAGMRAVGAGKLDRFNALMKNPPYGLTLAGRGKTIAYAKDASLINRENRTRREHPMSGLATKQHEDFHLLMSRVQDKYQAAGRRNLAANLYAAMHPEAQQAVDDYAKYRAPSNFDRHEERLANLFNYLNNPGERQKYAEHLKRLGGDWKMPRFDPRHQDQKMKEAFRVLQGAMKEANEDWVTQDFTQPLQKADPPAPPGTPPPKKPRAKKQAAPPRDPSLVVLHNLSAGNLLHAHELGGLAAPSLAITHKDHPLEGFGEISLVGDHNLVDPQHTPVFNSDIYSPRHPRAQYDVDHRGFRDTQKWLRPWQDKMGAYHGPLEEEMKRGGIEQALGHRDIRGPLGLAYLHEKGMAPELPQEPINLQHNWVTQPAMKEFIAKHGLDPHFEHGSQYHHDFSQAAKVAHEQHVAEQFYNNQELDPEDRQHFGDVTKQHFLENYFDDDGKFLFGRTHGVFNSLRDAGKSHVDSVAAHHLVTDKIKELGEPEFEDWAREKLKPAQGKQYLPKWVDKWDTGPVMQKRPYNMDAVMREMTRKIRQGEDFNYGLGTARAAGAKKFRNLDQIKAEHHKIVSKQEFEKHKKEMDDRFGSLVSELDQYHPAPGGFGSLERLANAIGESYKRGRSVWGELKKDGFQNVPPEVIAKVGQFAHDLVNMPTEYFEAKPQRVVGIHEFKGAAVPHDVSPRALEVLQHHGVNHIEHYKRDDEGDRARAIQRIAEAKKLMLSEPEVGEPLAKMDEDEIPPPHPQTQTPEFKAWFRKSKAVHPTTGQPLRVYHGTTHEFNEFGSKKNNPENWYGRGHYFSSSPQDVASNYATEEGPDLTGRVELEAERIAHKYPDRRSAEEAARTKIIGPGARTIPAYLSMQNPVVIKPEGGTRYDYNEEFDDDGNFTGKVTGNGKRLIDSAKRAALKYQKYDPHLDPDDVVGRIFEHGGLVNGDTTAHQVDKSLRNWDYLRDMYDRQGNNLHQEFIKDVFRGAGHDGIVMDASHFQNMPYNKGTTHYVVFHPTQIKSAVGNAGTFDPKAKDFGKTELMKSDDLDEIGRLLQHPDLVERQLALKLHGVRPHHLIAALDDPEIADLALQHANANSQVIFHALARPELREQALRHPAMSPPLFPVAFDASKGTEDAERVLNAILTHPLVDENTVRHIYGQWPTPALMQHRLIPQDLLHDAIENHPDNDIGLAAVGHPSVAPEVIEKLLRGEPSNLWEEAAGSSVIPKTVAQDILRRGHMNTDEHHAAVRRAVVENPNVTPDIVEIALHDIEPSIRMLARIRLGQQTDEDVLDHEAAGGDTPDIDDGFGDVRDVPMTPEMIYAEWSAR